MDKPYGMTEQEVVDLMASSKSALEWDRNADAVKEACDGYPHFWFGAVMASGVAARTMDKFGKTPEFKVEVLNDLPDDKGDWIGDSGNWTPLDI